MGDKTAIEWTDVTWNPWQGCHKLSPACAHCYMFREKERYGQNPDVVVRSKPPTFNLPLKLKEPAKVFTCSWSDFFIDEADPWRAEAWQIIERTPHLFYQIVTKRIDRAAACLPWGDGKPWPHVMVIVTAEDQPRADLRVPPLLDLNVQWRGVSYEPALGPVDFSKWIKPLEFAACWGKGCRPTDVDYKAVGAIAKAAARHAGWARLDWIICGGESGPKAWPMHADWARSVRDQCQAAGVPFFFKQWGEWAPRVLPWEVDEVETAKPSGMPSWIESELRIAMLRVGKKAAGRLLDGREWNEFPKVD